MNSLKYLIKTFCRAGEFRPVEEVFETALSICGHNEVLYSLMFNELLVAGEILDAKQLFEAALDRCLDINVFDYTDFIDKLYANGSLESAHEILKLMLLKGGKFDPAAFMPIIEQLEKCGNKREVNELTERMLAVGSEVEVESKVPRRQHKDSESDWKNILHREDGSATAMKILKRVENGWGHGNLSLSHAHNWDDAI